MTSGVFVGIIAVFIILAVLYIRKPKEKSEASGCLTCLGAVGVIVLLFVGYGLYSAYKYLEADTKWYEQTELTAEDKERWSYRMFLPEAEHCFEHYFIYGIRDPRYLVETRAYNSVEEMCADLPEGCEKAISAALNGKPQDEEDVHGVDVKQYKVSNELLPLISESEVQTRYGWYSLGAPRYYYIDEYEDGTFRFTVQYVLP